MRQFQLVNNDNDVLAKLELPEGAPDAGNRAEELIKEVARHFANIFEGEVFIDEMFDGVAVPFGIDGFFPVNR